MKETFRTSQKRARELHSLIRYAHSQPDILGIANTAINEGLIADWLFDALELRESELRRNDNESSQRWP